jgi:2-keto-3-deoxy-L-rhamnonate aldolase RhmA
LARQGAGAFVAVASKEAKVVKQSTLKLLGISMALSAVLIAARPHAQPGTNTPKGRLNQIIEQFEQGKPAFANEHWQFISLEHTLILDNYAKAMASLRPAEGTRPRLSPIVRLAQAADQEFRHAVKQVLDDGAFGIILPDVKTKEEVERFVSSMRYPQQPGSKYPRPEGTRGWGPTGATRMMGGLSNAEHHRKADLWPLNPEGELLAIVMIETREAIKNIDEILKVPGLGAALIGPADLSLALGAGTPAPNPSAPAVEAATATVAKACVAQKKLCGTFESPDVNARLAQGFKLFARASK